MSKSGSLGWMLLRITLFVLLAAGIFGAVIYKTMQDEDEFFRRKCTCLKIRYVRTETCIGYRPVGKD